jgi:hypothetical protein
MARKIENVIELNEYNISNICNRVLIKYLQIQSLIEINDKLMGLRENILMEFMMEKTVKQENKR